VTKASSPTYSATLRRFPSANLVWALVIYSLITLDQTFTIEQNLIFRKSLSL